mmetsp:Transcript_115988/g.200558  ORF Transcript_115988/g.200558 Transcript_115988/m.200558 type:complete len:717 (+) Transcript_115988:74-2224(+)
MSRSMTNGTKRLKRKKVRKACAADAGTMGSKLTTSQLEDPPRRKRRVKKNIEADAGSVCTACDDKASLEQPAISQTGEKSRKRKPIRKARVPDSCAATSDSKTIKLDDFPTKKEWRERVKQAQLPQPSPVPEQAKENPGNTSVTPGKAVHAKPDVNDPQCASKSNVSAESAEKCGAKRKPPTDPEQDSVQAKKARGVDGTAIKLLGTAVFRQTHNIVVTGTCPAPFENFEAVESQFGERLVAAMRSQGYTAPTPIQAQAWPLASRGQDMVAVAKTGSGKTLAFMMPALARLCQTQNSAASKRGGPAQPKVLVLAPTRELAQQIAAETQKFAMVPQSRVVAIYGGVPKGDQVRELQLGSDIVIATPGRLLDFAADRPEKGQGSLVSMKCVSYLVLDEADRMLDMGFEPDIRKIIADCPKSGRPEAAMMLGCPDPVRQTLFFTATWPKAVQRTAASLTTSGAVQIRIGQGAGGDKLTANTDVRQVVAVIDERQKLTRLHEILAKELGAGESAFIFAKTRHTCDYLEGKLWDEKEDLSIGTWCRAMHSHKEQWERDASLATFRDITLGKDNGRRGILVATDVAARGLDIPGVALVVVYDFGGGNLGQDSGVESYVHRIGRTGRAGKSGKAFTFFTEHDSGAAKLVKLLDDAKQRVPHELRALAERRGGGKGSKGGKGFASGKGGKGTQAGKNGKSGKGGKGKRDSMGWRKGGKAGKGNR